MTPSDEIADANISPPSDSAPPDEPAPAVERTSRAVKVRLSAMMFLQYFIQGSFLPIASVYVRDSLGFDSHQLGWFTGALALGPLIAPFVLGQFVDRYWPTERVLAISHLIAGGVMIYLYTQTGFAEVVAAATIYAMLYVPSVMLTNSLAFAHLKDRGREFPLIRVWGTIGFVLPAWMVEGLWLSRLEGAALNQARGALFLLAGVAGLIMGLYSFTLPHTPPQPDKNKSFAPGRALRFMLRRDLAVLVVVSFFIAMTHKFYFLWNSPFLRDLLNRGGVLGGWEARISSIGQISEVVVMAGLGWLIARRGFKFTITLGTIAYLARCLIFAGVAGSDMPFALGMTLTCVGQAMHGVCFACFLAGAFIYVDRASPPDIRGSMQNIFGTFLLGLGFLAGAAFGAAVGHQFSAVVDGKEIHTWNDWVNIWLVCAALAGACVLTFVALFPRREPTA